MRLQRIAYGACIAAIFVFIFSPLVVAVYASFFSDKILSFPPAGYTLDWYAFAWRRGEFSAGFLLSTKIAVLAAVLAILVGIPAAIAVERSAMRGKLAVREFLMSPFYIPAIVLGAALYVFYIDVESATGLRLAGTFPGLVAAHTLIALPWVLRLLCTALAMAPRSGEEAAQSLGASRFQVFYLVTLPAIRPGIIASALFAFIASFGELEKSLFLSGPGQQTLPVAVVAYLQYALDSTIAAIATVQIIVVAAALVISNRFVNLGRVL